jgi:GT2 family glycosyltransferase
MVEIAEANEKIGVVGCKLIYPDGRTQYIGTKVCVKGLLWSDPTICDKFPEVFEVDDVLGACFLIKRKVLDIIGLFD